MNDRRHLAVQGIFWKSDFDATPGKNEKKEEEGVVARFFHHRGKTGAQAKEEDPTPEPSPDGHKHHFLRRLFHRGS